MVFFTWRSISSAPVMTRRTSLILSHFAAKIGIDAIHRAVLRRASDGPSFSRPLNRDSQTSSAVKHRMGASQVVRQWKS